MHPRPSGPPPFFLQRDAYLGAAVDLLEGTGLSLRGDWVDHRQLSGERFFRLLPGKQSLRLPGDGEVVLRFRDRSMVPGQLSFLDAKGEVRHPQNVTASTEWQTLRVETPPGIPSPSLCLDLPARAAWELACLRWHPLDRVGLRQEQERRAALPVPANLLPASRFPLGLPQGWALERNLSPDTVFPNEGETLLGPSGCPALCVTTEQSGWIRSPQMLAWGEGPHTASLWLRGTGSLRLALRASRRELAHTVFEAESVGAFVCLPFTPTDAFTPFSFELSWKGNIAVHIDSLRVAPPGAAADFAGRGRCEIALSPLAEDGLHAPGEPLELRRWISGSPLPGDAWVWTCFDLYGRQSSGREPISRPDRAATAWALPDHDLSPLGSYRVETWVEDADGAVCSGVSEIVLHRIPEARTPWGGENPHSAFGAHVLPTHRHLHLAKRVGMNWVRLHGPGSDICYWYNLEPERGTWNFRSDLLARYRGAGFTVLGKLTSTPRWASGQCERVHSYFDQFVAPQDLPAWKEYVRATVAHYGADIPVYEVWNEPWLDKFFSRAVQRSPEGTATYPRPEKPVAAYATLCQLAAEAAASASPCPRLIGLNTTTNRNIAGWMDGDDWTRLADENGALDPVQILSYHDYSSAPDPRRQFNLSRSTFRFALCPLLEKGPMKKAVWNTEGSPQPEGLSTGFFRRLLPDETVSLPTLWDEAERQARYILAQRVEGVEKIFLYTLHNCHGLGEDNGFTVLLAPDGSPHPVAASFAVLAHAIDGLRPVVTEHDGSGWRIRFEGANAGQTQVYLADETPVLPPAEPDFGPWCDLFGNPVEDTLRGCTFFRTQIAGDEHDDR